MDHLFGICPTFVLLEDASLRADFVPDSSSYTPFSLGHASQPGHLNNFINVNTRLLNCEAQFRQSIVKLSIVNFVYQLLRIDCLGPDDA